ncbi:MAG: phytoene desaturase, partial [Candidatus Andersenbacteria bacterium]|nr:phytoene desaturase [Candidatus Andersenbacteria bacterium]
MSKRIAIIGAGFGGISAAALLARQGHQVTVFEKNEHEGGRASMWYERGFSFDMGPSWYLMPDVFEKFFAKFGKRPSEYYTLSRLDPSYRMFFGDGAPLDISSSLEENKKLFDALEPNGGAKLQTYLDQAEYQYDSAMETFVERDYQSVMDFLDWRLAKEGIRMRMFNSLDSHVSRLFSNDRAKKILGYTTGFLGGNPKNTPGVYALIAHVDFNLGVWYPQGGLHAVATG